MNQHIHLQQIKEAELQAVYELVQNTIEVSYAGVYPPEAIAFFKNHHCQENILKDLKAGYIVVVEAGGQILGTGNAIGDECAPGIHTPGTSTPGNRENNRQQAGKKS